MEGFMNAHVTELIKTAKSTLTPEERFTLAEAMLESVKEPSDPQVEQAWATEIERRMKEVEAGTAEYSTSEEVYVEVKKLLK
jgi:putative addiction module component (TIGR02574 family)